MNSSLVNNTSESTEEAKVYANEIKRLLNASKSGKNMKKDSEKILVWVKSETKRKSIQCDHFIRKMSAMDFEGDEEDEEDKEGIEETNEIVYSDLLAMLLSE